MVGVTLAGQAPDSAVGYSGLGIAALSGLGLAHVLRKSWQAAAGKIPEDRINDGVVNGLTAAALTGQAVLAAVTGQGMIAASQGIMAASALKILYETRSALAKDKATP